MDVNVTSTDVKTYGVPTVPTVELEDAAKAPVQPIPENTEAVTVDLNDQALHGRQGNAEQKTKNEMAQEDLEEAIEEIQSRFESMGSSFRFGLFKHMETESIVGQLRDKNTNEIIKQFPSEEILKLRAKLKDLIGLIFDEKV